MKQGSSFLLSLITLILFFSSCSHVDRDGRILYRSQIKSGDFEKAQATFDQLDIAKNEKSLLLFYMEKGLFYHLKKEYQTSNEFFLKAQKKAQELYTTRISGKLAKFTGNDQEDFYYGENYEKSLVFYYMALNHYLLYQQTNDVSDLRKARSNLLAWDSALKTIKSETKGESVFKEDLLAKLFGAFIHELISYVDDPKDKMIAINLYKESLEILFKYYNAYGTFNGKNTQFKKEFKNLHELPRSKVQEQFVQETSLQKKLTDFIQSRIVALQSKESQEKKILIHVLIEQGQIPEKVPDVYDFSLEGALANTSGDSQDKSTAMMIGTQVLSNFMSQVLGLDSPSSGGQALAGVGSTLLAARYAGIKFELPKLQAIQKDGTKDLELYLELEEQGQNSAPLRQDLYLSQPLIDVAQEAIEEHAASDYVRVGTRVTMKHLTAILAAYATYRSFGQGNEFFGKTAALLEYTVASKLIAETEKADLRLWSTLPQDIWLTQFSLLPGKAYNFYLCKKNKVTQEIQRLKIGEKNFSDSKNPYFFLSSRVY